MLAIRIDSLEVTLMSADDSEDEFVTILLRKDGIDTPIAAELTQEALSDLIAELKAFERELYPKGVFKGLSERKRVLRRKQCHKEA